MDPAEKAQLNRLQKMESACQKCRNVEFLDLFAGITGFCIRRDGRQSTRLDLMTRCPQGNRAAIEIINGGAR